MLLHCGLYDFAELPTKCSPQFAIWQTGRGNRAVSAASDALYPPLATVIDTFNREVYYFGS